MQYHAMSFIKEGFTVDIIGYPGSLPLKEIRKNPSVRVYYLYPPPSIEDSTYILLLTVLILFFILINCTVRRVQLLRIKIFFLIFQNYLVRLIM